MRRFSNIRLWLGMPAVLIVALCACSPSHSTAVSHASQAAASANANIPGADKAAAQALIRQCVPVSASGSVQLKWATALVNDHQPHLNGSRNRLAACFSIPAPRRPAAESVLITDIEHVHWLQKTSRQVFWDSTLPQWVITWRGLQ